MVVPRLSRPHMPGYLSRAKARRRLKFALKLGMLAFDATRLCASDVYFPIDVLLYRKGTFEFVEHRFDRDELSQISRWWQERMRSAVDDLPSEWIDAALSKLRDSRKAPADWLATGALR